jgi:hypothetical protein
MLGAVVAVRAQRHNLRLVSGGARGADEMAQVLAGDEEIQIQVFLADWAHLGKGAAFARNQLIVDAADAVLAFFGPGEKSHGTLDTIRRAVAARKPTASHHRHQWTHET